MCSTQYLLSLFVALMVKDKAVQRIPPRAPDEPDERVHWPGLG